MRAIQADIFWCSEITLRKINHRAIAMSALNEIINQWLLILFGNKIIENNQLLIFPCLFRNWDDFIRGCFHNIIPSFFADWAKRFQQMLIFGLVKIFRIEINFIVEEQAENHIQENICFPRS